MTRTRVAAMLTATPARLSAVLLPALLVFTASPSRVAAAEPWQVAQAVSDPLIAQALRDIERYEGLADQMARPIGTRYSSATAMNAASDVLPLPRGRLTTAARLGVADDP